MGLSVGKTNSINYVNSYINKTNNELSTDNESIQAEDAYIVELSSEGVVKATASEMKLDNENQREAWENNFTVEERSQVSDLSIIPMMKIYHPELYDEYIKYKNLHDKCDPLSDEAGRYGAKYIRIKIDYEEMVANDYHLRLIRDREFYGTTKIYKLNKMFTGLHDTNFNYYTKFDDDSMMWNHAAKYNILLSSDMLKDLQQDPELASDSELLKRIRGSIDDMEELNSSYSGNLKCLSFGVKLYDDGSVTYHANYLGYENRKGIQASNKAELLRKLKEEE